MLAIVMVAALAAAGAAFVSLPLAVAVAVPDPLASVELLDPPHAVTNPAASNMPAQNKPIRFIVTPLD
jgi:hypothetical protein